MATKNSWNSSNPVEATKGGTAQSTYAKGDILYASAANTLSKLAVGTNNYILKVSTDVPAWASGVPGNEILLSTQTAATTATLDYTSKINNSLYEYYKFLIISVKPATDTANLLLLFSIDNGSTWLGSTGYKWSRYFANSAGVGQNNSTGDSSIQLGASLGTNTGEGVSGVLYYYPSSAPGTTYQQCFWNMSNYNSAASLYKYSGAGLNTTTSAIDAVQFKMSSGDISTGTINMYGILK